MDIRVFGTPVCPQCKNVTMFLKTHGVDHQYMTIGQDVQKEDVESVVGRNIRAVPVIVKDGTEITFGALQDAVLATSTLADLEL